MEEAGRGRSLPNITPQTPQRFDVSVECVCVCAHHVWIIIIIIIQLRIVQHRRQFSGREGGGGGVPHVVT